MQLLKVFDNLTTFDIQRLQVRHFMYALQNQYSEIYDTEISDTEMRCLKL